MHAMMNNRQYLLCTSMVDLPVKPIYIPNHFITNIIQDKAKNVMESKLSAFGVADTTKK